MSIILGITEEEVQCFVNSVSSMDDSFINDVHIYH